MALTDKLTAIADAIRAKTGKTGALTLDQMATTISTIETGVSIEELVAALQYSGLGLTDESTSQEILDALSAKFPAEFWIFKEGVGTDRKYSLTVGSVTASQITLQTSYPDHSYYAEMNFTEVIDVTNYNYLTVEYATNCTSVSNTAKISLVSLNDSSVNSIHSKSQTASISRNTVKVPISEYKGEYTIRVNYNSGDNPTWMYIYNMYLS